MNGMRIRGIAAYAPPNIVSNEDIAEKLNKELLSEIARRAARNLPPLSEEEEKKFKTNDRWIRRMIGFSNRRFVREGEGTIDLACKASKLLLEGLQIDPAEVDGIVFGTVTPSYPNSPPDANLLQDMLGIPAFALGKPRKFFGIDTALACSTWVASLQVVYALIASGLYRNILLIGADAMSTTINWKDRAFACVLGDAGTATYCSAVDAEEDWFGRNRFFTHSDGKHWDAIITLKGGSRNPILTNEDIEEYRNRLSMDGPRVKDLIVPLVGGPAIEAALHSAGWKLSDLNLASLHEANRAQLNAKITFEEWKSRGFVGDILDAAGEFGNTTSASIPLALALNGEKLRESSRQPKKIALVAKGGSITVSIALGEIKHELQTFVEI